MWFWTSLALLLPLDPSMGGASPLMDRPAVTTNPQWAEKPVAPLMSLADAYGIESGRYAVECENPASRAVIGCEATLVGVESISSGDPYIATRVGHAIGGLWLTPAQFDGLDIWSLVSFEVSFTTVDGQRRVQVSDVVCVRCLTQEYGEEASPEVVLKNQADFPLEATQIGEQSGYAVLRCRANGTAPVTECSVWLERPFGLGFGREALRAAQENRLKPLMGASGLIRFVVPFEAE
ncbi:hypothetical protein [Brevundimonas sp.]|uniref:hypothetical protein n=1 Tax=Brevundimonas sp. TaxID=1871086 RepID=UPI0035126DB5